MTNPLHLRRGVQHLLTLDPEASALLKAMAVGHKASGRLVSQLVFAEHARRQERAKILAVIDAMEPDPVQEEVARAID